jgi:DNA-binding HxlR family transcriptional regulator
VPSDATGTRRVAPLHSYALTDRGKALIPALAQISPWAQEHLAQDET